MLNTIRMLLSPVEVLKQSRYYNQYSKPHLNINLPTYLYTLYSTWGCWSCACTQCSTSPASCDQVGA
jgi:hypothetical protein